MSIHDGHRKRLKDRFINEGIKNFEDHTCLELLLFYSIPQRDTNPIAHKLIEHFGSLSAVFSATVEELCEVDGITENSAVLISAIPGIMARAKLKNYSGTVINSAELLCDYCKTLFFNDTTEKLKVICFDNKLRVSGCEEISSGTSGRIAFDARKVVEAAMKHKSDLIVITHNHPKGNSLPSNADLAGTNMIKNVLGGIGIKLMDHIIVGDDTATSLKNSGYMFDL